MIVVQTVLFGLCLYVGATSQADNPVEAFFMASCIYVPVSLMSSPFWLPIAIMIDDKTKQR